MVKNKRNVIIGSSTFIIVIALIWLGSSFMQNNTSNESDINPATKATIYKSPTCGCCVKYISYLKKQDFVVETVTTEDMWSIKNQYQIPSDMESCHTTVIGDYFIEGHVPLEAVEKLLQEQPDIDGIALPDMPAGSPGMPGKKQGEWQIYTLKNGEVNQFVNL